MENGYYKFILTIGDFSNCGALTSCALTFDKQRTKAADRTKTTFTTRSIKSCGNMV